MNKKAFTLVELLATIVIIALIMGIVLPSATRVSRDNKDKLCESYQLMMEEYAAISPLKENFFIDLNDLDDLDIDKEDCSGYVIVDHSVEPLKYKAEISCKSSCATDSYNANIRDTKLKLSLPTCPPRTYSGVEQRLIITSDPIILTNNLRKDVGSQHVRANIDRNDKRTIAWFDDSQDEKVIRNCSVIPRTITVIADNKVMTYGDTVPEFTYQLGNTVPTEPNPLTVRPSYRVKNGSTTINASASTNVGTYVIEPYGAEIASSNYNAPNYTNGTLTINQKALTITAKPQTITYGDSVSQATNQVNVSGLVNGDQVTSVSLAQSTTNATTNGTITPSNIVIKNTSNQDVTSNYSISYNTGTLTINRAKTATTGNCSNPTYDGTSKTLATGASYATYSNNSGTNVKTSGSYSVTVTADSNHLFSDGTASKTLSCNINRKALTITAKAQTIDYGSSITTGVGQVTTSGLVSGDSLTGITLTASTGNVPGGTITPSAGSTSKGIGNYSVTYNTGTLTIKPVKAVITCANKTYSGSAQTIASCSGGTVSGASQTNYKSGGYTITCSGDANHTAADSKTCYINQKGLTITANAQTIYYGNSITIGVGQVTTSGLVSGDSLTGITLTANTSSVTTSGKITPSSGSTSKGIGNYSVTYNTGTLTIKAVKAVITCANKTYSGSAQTIASCSGGTVSGASQTNYKSGGYTITCSGDANHTAADSKTCYINQKGLTITANAQTIDYGSSISTGIGYVTTSGLVSGDSLTSISLSASTGNVPGGTITPSSGSTSKGIGNYSVTYNKGTLTIKPVAPGIICKNPIYNGTQQNILDAWSGCTPSNNMQTNVGRYDVTCTGDENHTDITVPCEIAPKPCTNYQIQCNCTNLSESPYHYDLGWTTYCSSTNICASTDSANTACRSICSNKYGAAWGGSNTIASTLYVNGHNTGQLLCK